MLLRQIFSTSEAQGEWVQALVAVMSGIRLGGQASFMIGRWYSR